VGVADGIHDRSLISGGLALISELLALTPHGGGQIPRGGLTCFLNCLIWRDPGRRASICFLAAFLGGPVDPTRIRLNVTDVIFAYFWVPLLFGEGALSARAPRKATRFG
jgi:hypothetical protein